MVGRLLSLTAARRRQGQEALHFLFKSQEDLEMYENVIHNTEELNAMAVHLRMAHNFSELRLLAAEWLVPEQDLEDFISGKRFLLAEIPMSERNYVSAAEKLREEMWHLKDQLFTDLVAQYLIGRAKEDILFGFRVLKSRNRSRNAWTIL